MVIPPEFGLAWFMGRAPMTSSTAQAIEATRSPVEQEIQNAVAHADVGFRDGWISSTWLRRLLERVRCERGVNLNQVSGLLDGLGYCPHPALQSTQGQTHNVVQPDANKPRLYIRNDHPALGLTRPAEVAYAC
jgi:hypothetical protein